MPPVIFLLGATAVGKTELAARLHDAMPAELISVDAAQVYRGMDIGTGKPNAEFLAKYPHHLIDIRAPTETYNAARFCKDAKTLIAEIHAREKIPILVGGTMFYYNALEQGLSALPSADAKLRAEIADEIAGRGLGALYAELKKVDAKLAAQIKPTDRQRIQRAMEIYRLTKTPPTMAMAREGVAPLSVAPIKIGLYLPDRAALHKRIHIRFEKMLERGLVDEVKAIIAAMHSPQKYPAMRTVNYRQVHSYLRGEISYDEMKAQAVAATRQLAKRQLTWMRGMRDLKWVDNSVDATEKILAYLKTKAVG